LPRLHFGLVWDVSSLTARSIIPASLRGWVADIADRGGFPLEYPAAASIVGLSGLIGRRIALRPKRADDWLVVPNLWGAVVGQPGIQKTPAVEEALRPLRRLASDSWRDQLQAAASFAKGRMVIEARQEAARLALRKAARQGKTDDELDRLAAGARIDIDPLSAKTRSSGRARLEPDHVPPGKVSQPHAVAGAGVPLDRLAFGDHAQAGFATGRPRRRGLVRIA
jgi:hypothetical protein